MKELTELMVTAERFVILEIASLTWPTNLQISSKYFRLFVAADSTSTSSEQISAFARDALTNGMVYCCSWGAGCERLHDIVDEECERRVSSDQLVLPTNDDTVMTTWHEDESLEDALEFFVRDGLPTPGFVAESALWVVVAVANPNWTKVLRKHLATLRSHH